jgi:hypothetical protein
MFVRGDFFAGRAVRALGGRAKQWPYRSIVLKLARKIARQSAARLCATVNGLSNLRHRRRIGASSTTRADGFVIVPADSEGRLELKWRPAHATRNNFFTLTDSGTALSGCS